MPKTIFNTTEKSNFILNMKTEEYRNFLLKILLGFAVLMPLFCVPLEFLRVYSVPFMALSIVGVAAMVFVLIGFMKKITPRSLVLPAILLGGSVIWSIVSLLNSYFYNISLIGADGRGEGILSVVFYACFFLLGAQIGTSYQKLLNGLLWMGLVQCAWGLLQALPLEFPSYYQNLDPLLLFRTFLPSGLTGSPIFLAVLLVMLSVPAMLGAAFEEERKHRIFYLVCAAVFVLMAVKTQCLIGVAGSALAIILSAVYLLVKRGGKNAYLALAAAVIAFAIGIGWICVSPAMNGTYSRATGENVQVENGFALYDGGIIWEDSAYRLAESGYYIANNAENPNGSFDIHSISDSYGYLWKSTLSIIQRFPLVGSGPDNLVYPQFYQNVNITGNPNTFDRCYNYYLHLAATMGVPALLLHLALMAIVAVRGAKQLKRSSWVLAGIYGAVMLYLILMLVGTSAVTTAPVFWMLAGVCIGEHSASKS